MTIVKEVLYNNTEGLDLVDLNGMQRIARAQISDVWGFRLGEAEHVVDRVEFLCNAIGDGGAPHVDGAANRQVLTRPGTIIHALDVVIDGETPQALAYNLAGDELATTFDVGDANDRWDVVSVHFAYVNGSPEARQMRDNLGVITANPALNKRRNLTLTKTVTKGTPAGSPVVPSIPAGDVAVYAVRIPAGLGAAPIDPGNIRDLRLPLGVHVVDVWSCGALSAGAVVSGSFTAVPGAVPLVRSVGTGDQILHFPSAAYDHSMRLVSVAVLVGESTASVFKLVRVHANGTFTDITTSLTSLRRTLAGANMELAESVRINLSPATVPAWANGWEAGYAKRWATLTPPNNFDRLALLFESGAANEEIAMVRFTFAGGL